MYYSSEVMRLNVYSSAVIAGGKALYTQILPTQGRPPATILGIKKLETLGYPISSHPSAFPRFDTILECDGQTDGPTDRRICRSIYRACKASLERCKTRKRCRSWLELGVEPTTFGVSIASCTGALQLQYHCTLRFKR